MHTLSKFWSKKPQQTPLHESLKKCKQIFWVIFTFAFASNLLLMVTPLYSLQVLDRVIGSGNTNTLLMLSLLIAVIYLGYSLVQVSRSIIMIRLGQWLEHNTASKLFQHAVSLAATRPSLSTQQILRDFQTVKVFLTSTGLNTLLDAPWSIMYIIIIVMINKYIGIITVIGAIIVIILALINAFATNKKLGEANEDSIKSLTQAEIAARNAEVIEAMGMMKNITKDWFRFNNAALKKQSMANYRNGIVSNFARFMRHLIQMSVTGVSAYIVVSTGGQDMTAGAMIATSIMVGRALAPFDNAIEIWKQISSTIKSYKRINHALAHPVVRNIQQNPNQITCFLSVHDISYAYPTTKAAQKDQKPKYVLQNISFQIIPGEVVAVIGPSASGKSTLSKIIIGVWKANSGEVLLDNTEISDWNRENLGEYIGYLPQNIELFNGSVKQNIARMDDNPSPEKIVRAAKMAGAHEMILRLEDGYDSDIGIAGSKLSGGQKQRIALARAFYGDPKFLVLDEPNANLDDKGEQDLTTVLQEAKKQNIAIVVISHRTAILSIVDKVLHLQCGYITDFGPKEAVLKKMKLTNGKNFYKEGLSE